MIFANHAPKNYKIGLPGRASVGGGGLAARPGPTLQGRKVATGKLGRKKMVQLGTATTSRARGVRVRGLLSSARRTSRLASWPGLGGPRFIENNQLFQFYNCPPGPACRQTHTHTTAVLCVSKPFLLIVDMYNISTLSIVDIIYLHTLDFRR